MSNVSLKVYNSDGNTGVATADGNYYMSFTQGCDGLYEFSFFLKNPIGKLQATNLSARNLRLEYKSVANMNKQRTHEQNTSEIALFLGIGGAEEVYHSISLDRDDPENTMVLLEFMKGVQRVMADQGRFLNLDVELIKKDLGLN